MSCFYKVMKERILDWQQSLRWHHHWTICLLDRHSNYFYPWQADPAQVLNVPVIPIGTLLAAAHPFAANPPYLLSWLSPQISALDMLQPKLFETLVTENFIKKICFTFGFQDNAQMLNVDSGIDAFNCHIAHYDIVGAQRLEVVETSSSFKLRSVFFPHEGRSRLKKNLQASLALKILHQLVHIHT
ncbi:uncharacterized protein [Gossypium hirsutum]|uniref:Uncharacterized protein isoform X4 n=2 Tax=Gossypium hirsutum TaxID=3635 RepID=A0ABM3BBE9_GOSHI|nr:uncharacterized protein LOC107942685 isoform X4 [Gossypium hirsutum]